MLYTKETTGSLESVSRRLISAASVRGMRAVGRHVMKWNPELSDGHVGWECRVYEFCHVVNFRRALESNLTAVLALPCRVGVYGRPGAVILSTLKITALLEAAGIRQDIHAPADAIERAICAAIDDACATCLRHKPHGRPAVQRLATAAN